MTLAPTLFYLSNAALYSVCMYWTFNYIPVHRPIPGLGVIPTKLSYVTNWDVFFQVIYCSVACYEFATRGSRAYYPSKTRRFLARALSGPFGIFVFITFWGLYALDRELVYPRSWTGIPEWWNQAVHTMPLITIIGDRYFSDIRQSIWAKSRASDIEATVLVAACYLSWVLYLGFAKTFWVYPILGVLDWIGRSAFMAACCLLLGLCFFIADRVSNSFWRNAVKVD